MAQPSAFPDEGRADGHYDAGLARIHAGDFEPALAPAWPWLLDEVRRSGATPHLHDLGCGAGLFLAAAVAQGLRADGSDVSPAFVDLARARGLDVWRASAASAPWRETTTAITALGEVLCYLDGEEAALFTVAGVAAAQMSKGSVLIADLIGPAIEPGGRSRSGSSWAITAETSIEGDMLTRRIDWRSDRATGETVHRQRIFDPSTVARRLRELGFDVDVMDSFGAHPLLPGRFAIRAVRG